MTKNDTPYKPVNDIVLIRVEPPKTETASGIIIKEDWKTLPPTGVVIAGGPQVDPHYIGATVVFERYSSIILEEGLRLCKATNILAIKDA